MEEDKLYLEYTCKELIYNPGFVDGNFWIYILLLTSKDFAHDVVLFEPPKKCKCYIAYIARKLINYRICLMEDDDILQKLHCWCFYSKDPSDIEETYDLKNGKKILISFMKM